MQAIKFLFGSLFVLSSLVASAAEPMPIAAHPGEDVMVETIQGARVAPCKASGDGTYVLMITTMASVLPPAEADAFLARYCDTCFRQKFLASHSR